MTLSEHWFVDLFAFGKVETGPIVQPFLGGLSHGFGDFLDWKTEGSEVLFFGFDFLGMILVDLFKEFDFLSLEVFELFFFVLFLFCDFHDVLGLFKVETADFFLPVLHIPFLGLLGVFNDFLFFFFLMGQELPIHFLNLFSVFIGNIFQLPSIVKLH